MKLIRGMKTKACGQKCVATIGAFDALHIGHQAVIKKTKLLAKRLDLPAALVMFEPLPSEFFVSPSDTPSRVYSFRQRLEIVQSLGLDYVVCLSFTPDLAMWPAEKFINRVVIDTLQARHLVIGDDFCFGKDRQGDFTTLRTYGERYGFEVEKIAAVTRAGIRISSTYIRQLLMATEIIQANRLLGRAYKISGRVRRGNRRGTKIGYPTANLVFNKQRPPLHGVYAAELIIPKGIYLHGIINAGLRPTVDGKQYRIEAHIFDFDEDLYGQRIEVRPLHYIRAEQKYASLGELKDAIADDIQCAQSWFLETEKSGKNAAVTVG